MRDWGLVIALFLLGPAARAYTPGEPAGVCDEADDLAYLNPGEWCQVPGSRMDAHAPVPLPGGAFNRAMAYSGGAFAHNPSKGRNTMVVWGGGHTDYAGNEVYFFDVDTLQWRRNEPSVADPCDVNPSACNGTSDPGAYLSDGKPRSNHSYDNVEYIPTIDRFVSAGNANPWYSGQGGTDRLIAYNFNRQGQSDEWDWMSRLPHDGGGCRGGLSAWDPETGLLWRHAIGGWDRSLNSWDPATDTWTVYNNGQWVNLHYTASVGNGLFVAVGRPVTPILVWDLSAPNALPTRPAAIGDTSILSSEYPGFEFDPDLRVFAAWDGGTDVYTVDVSRDAAVATRHPAAAGNVVDPGEPRSNGTFGRWRRVPSRGVYILVNAVNQNVYFYRLSSGGTTPPGGSPPPARPRRLRAR